MDKNLKTIRGSKRAISLWIGALYSGEYTQGQHKLKTPEGGFCCLGVLQDKLEGKVETYSTPGVNAGMSRGLPTQAWLTDHGLVFLTVDRDGVINHILTQAPYVYDEKHNRYRSVDALNDDASGNYPFEVIAALILNHVEYTDVES